MALALGYPLGLLSRSHYGTVELNTRNPLDFNATDCDKLQAGSLTVNVAALPVYLYARMS